MPQKIHIGTAGWSIPRASAHRVVGEGTHLRRYSQAFTCTEINSSFHRAHTAATYAKWRDVTPPDFRFALKLPRAITHDLKLRRPRLPFAQFLEQTNGLGGKRGPLLVQLPPSLTFDARVADRFFGTVRAAYDDDVICEPRHATWFSLGATMVLDRYRVSRVAADPSPVPEAAVPGGWDGVAYFRLHGSPRKYWSRYDAGYLAAVAATVRGLPPRSKVWCVFDNTASGAAFENAWELQTLLTRT